MGNEEGDQDEVLVKGKRGVKLICILELPPDDLKETIESLIELGLSRVEKMREVLQITGEILSRDGRFQDISEEMREYGEILFREDRCIPFTMIEARAIVSINPFRVFGDVGGAHDAEMAECDTIERRLEIEQG